MRPSDIQRENMPCNTCVAMRVRIRNVRRARRAYRSKRRVSGLHGAGEAVSETVSGSQSLEYLTARDRRLSHPRALAAVSRPRLPKAVLHPKQREADHRYENVRVEN